MISKQQVQHIAKLARLDVSPKQAIKMQKELAGILDYIDQLSEVDVSKVLPMFHSGGLVNVYRDDKSNRAGVDTIKQILEQLPDQERDFAKVQQVL